MTSEAIYIIYKILKENAKKVQDKSNKVYETLANKHNKSCDSLDPIKDFTKEEMEQVRRVEKFLDEAMMTFTEFRATK